MGYLVEDYFYDKYVPKKKGNNVIELRVINVGSNRYIARDSTPDEFVRTGTFIKREPIDFPKSLEKAKHTYFPIDWHASAPTEVDPRTENGQAPAMPQGIQIDLQAGSVNVIWNRVADDDIAGYRIYRQTANNIEKVASIPNNSSMPYIDKWINLQFVYGYGVTAVDIAGRESQPSMIAIQPPTETHEVAEGHQKEQQEEQQEQLQESNI